MKIILVGSFIFFITKCYSADIKYILNNEKVIYSFVTESGKIMTLCKDTGDKYIVYRFGTKDSIEIEFPQKGKNSWTKFKYSFYLRGGGVSNEGIDLNYVTFTNGRFKYLVYDTYFANGGKHTIGVRIFNTKSEEVMDFKGDLKTRQGTLIDFRDNGLIATDDELYD
jgi:hypothetical protein